MNNFFIIVLLFSFFSMKVYSRVYLEKEKFFSQANCEPRTFCTILKDYFITEPQLNRDILQPYQRLVYERKILEESNNLILAFSLGSNYNYNRQGSYFTLYDGLAIQSQAQQNGFNNIWNLRGLWSPFNVSPNPDRIDVVKSNLNNYFYEARLNVFNSLNVFLALRSPNNIFRVVVGSRILELTNFAIPLLQTFFKKEMYLYNQKLTPMEEVLALYTHYNSILNLKLLNYQVINEYDPSFLRLKNFVLNSIDAITLEFQDFVESHLSMEKFKVCTKKAYLEEVAKRTLYDIKLTYEESTQRYSNNISGFQFSIGGEVNKKMNLTGTLGYGFSYQLLESDAQKLFRWEYIIRRKNLTDDFTKNIEMEENFLRETFLYTQTLRENYLQRKENREQVYLLLKGKIINRFGDNNFKFGFTRITEKAKNLITVLETEMEFRRSLFSLGNGLFVGLSQCPLSEEIVEAFENL